jgi:hypothetical protein
MWLATAELEFASDGGYGGADLRFADLSLVPMFRADDVSATRLGVHDFQLGNPSAFRKRRGCTVATK